MSSTFGYQPAHAPATFNDSNVQKYEFDSPSTIAKQQQFQQAGGFQPAGGFSQAGGLPSQGLSAPPPAPALPQSSFNNLNNRRNLNLKTRNWSNQPWGNSQQNFQGIQQGDSYAPPASLLNNNWNSSRSVYSPSIWDGRTISSTSSSPRTPSLLGVYNPTSLSGQQSSSSPSTPYTSQSANYQPTTYTLPQGGVSSYPSSGLSGAQSFPSSNYQPSSTIPLHHNYHLPSSSLAQSSSQQQFNAPLNSGIQNQGIVGNQSSSIPPAPAWNGWNTNKTYRSRNSSQLPLRTRNWGNRGDNGWSGLNYKPAVQESFLQNRPQYPVQQSSGSVPQSSFNSVPQSSFSSAPQPPVMPSYGGQRKWNRGPYRQRNIRTKNWGTRSDNGWSGFNSGLYANEASLPFVQNRNLNWADESSLGQQQFQGNNLSTQQFAQQPQQQFQGNNFSSQQFSQQPQQFQGNNFSSQQFVQQPQQYQGSSFNNLSSQQGFAPISSSYSSAPISTISSAPISTVSSVPIVGAPIAAAPIGANNTGAPLTGRKAKKAQRKQAKLNAIQNKLVTTLNPPIGDPAVNHYRRGAHATVPTAGPLIAGVAPPNGSKRSRRTGRKNNLGRRSGRNQGAALPVPATQPPFVAQQAVAAPIMMAQPSYGSTILHPAGFNTMNAGAPVIGPHTGSYRSTPIVNTIPISTMPVSSSSAGIPLSSAQQPLYSNSTLQQRPLSSTLLNSQGTVSQQPLYSAKEPVAAHLLQKPAVAPTYVRPTGSATF